MLDVAEVVRNSGRFYRGHGLPDWATALPRSSACSVDRAMIERAEKQRFLHAFAFPPLALQDAQRDRLLDATVRQPATGLTENQQYRSEPFLSDQWGGEANGKLLQRGDDLGLRTEGPYLLLFGTRPAVNTWGKTARQLGELFQARGWRGLTVAEYFVLQRALCEHHGDHRFLDEPQDAWPTHWLWLLDSMTDEACSVAMGSSRGINVQACPNNHRDSRRAAVAGLVATLTIS